MIKNNSYSIDWINSLKDNKKKIDPMLCEKMIRALGLLEQLVLNGLDFIFKGGTSLILLIDDPQRFSIDIDINSDIRKDDLELILKKCDASGIFKRSEENIRKDRGIPKAHYKFFYDSTITNKEDFVLLDVLFHKHSYPETQETPIKSFWVDTEEPIIKVKTPTIDAVLGDKMTAYAPNTSGIPFGKDREMEIIKQLFDVGRLFNLASDINIISKSFYSIAEDEINFMNEDINTEDVLNDIINTGLLIAQLPKQTNDQQKELMKGIKSFRSYPINYKYQVDDAKISSAKAVYLASKILYKDNTSIKFYDESEMLKPNIIEGDLNYLNKLRKAVPEAYFYWIESLKLRNN